MELESAVRERVWSKFWRHGALHSLQGSFPGNYAGEIRDFWNDVFRNVDGTHHILDIGTGNGPLPAMLCERPDGHVPKTEAIDLATPMPAWFDSAPIHCRRAVTFHGGVNAEALPFASSTLDLAVSQYGIEYTGLPRALAELGRVLKKQASIAFVCHHARSRIAQIAADEVVSARLLLADEGILASAAELVPYIELASQGQTARLSGDPGATSARHAFNTSMSDIEHAVHSISFPDLLIESRAKVGSLIEDVFNQRRTAAAAHTALLGLRQEFEEGQFRQAELLSHALDEEDVARMSIAVQAMGFAPLNVGLAHHENLLLGWTLHSTRE